MALPLMLSMAVALVTKCVKLKGKVLYRRAFYQQYIAKKMKGLSFKTGCVVLVAKYL